MDDRIRDRPLPTTGSAKLGREAIYLEAKCQLFLVVAQLNFVNRAFRSECVSLYRDLTVPAAEIRGSSNEGHLFFGGCLVADHRYGDGR